MYLPPTSAPRRAAAWLLAAALLAFAGLTAGCGSSKGGGTSADPATAVPATAALYVGANVRPSGAEKEAALAAGKALTHQTNPYLRLLAALQTPGSPRLDFGKGVAPWLGEHAGAFVTSLGWAKSLTGLLAQGLQGGSSAGGGQYLFGGAGGAQGAIVLDTSDSAKARSFLDERAKAAGAHAASYRGVSYQTTTSGLAFGLVRSFAVIGSESGVHAVVDTVNGASSLAASGRYAKLLGSAPKGALAHVYSAGASATRSAKGAGPVQLLAGSAPANISLVPAKQSLTLDIDTISSATGGLLGTDPDAATALAQLPGDSWLAMGLGHVGSTLSRDVQRLQALISLGNSFGAGTGSSAASTLNLKSLLEAMLAPLKALGARTPAAQRAFASWMGSAGVFASGGSLLELRAAIVIASKNPSLSRAAVGRLAAELRGAGGQLRPVSIPGTDAAVGVALQGLPVVLDIADGPSSSGGHEFVLGFGEASVSAALHPPSTLAGASTFSNAAASLGEGIKPSLILNFPTLISLLEGVGLTEDPSLAKVLPYLRSAGTLAGGGRELGGGVQRYRLVLGLGRSEG